MDNPNASGNLRRRKSLPYRRIRPCILIKKRLQKTNPYVGSFRHSPPSTFRSCLLDAGGPPSRSATQLQQRSPYVGWFRHAPPSSNATRQEDRASRGAVIHRFEDHNDIVLCHQLAIIVASLPPSCRGGPHDDATAATRSLLDIINGRLLGGAPTAAGGNSVVDDEKSSHSVLARLGSWLAYDNSVLTSSSSSSTTTVTTTPNTSNASSLKKTLVPLRKVSEEDCGSSSPPDCTESDDDDDYSCYDNDHGGNQRSNNNRGNDGVCDDSDCSSLSDEDDPSSGHNHLHSSTVSSATIIRSNSINLGNDDDDANKRHTSKAKAASKKSRRRSSNKPSFDLSLSQIADTSYPSSSKAAASFHAKSGDSTAAISSLAMASAISQQRDGGDDYVISQMDIARMARNASRHLDVDSILKLPTITYHNGKDGPVAIAAAAKPPSQMVTTASPSRQSISAPFVSNMSSSRQLLESQAELGGGGAAASSSIIAPAAVTLTSTESIHDESWSWMMVPLDSKATATTATTELGSNNNNKNNKRNKTSTTTQTKIYTSSATTTSSSSSTIITPASKSNGCVICMEPFQNGDRLRVLPCDHLFHVGCIDKWLAGSHSFNDCYTNGCPTCKKQAEPEYEERLLDSNNSSKNNSSNMDGSVPSWAFARLGNVLARQASSTVSD
mmetsp:Transcript_13215/g.38118  ORF Transcript_13215/g.38118 Transcript_13215/m.38118 type:complete len:668 (+) Transcript_13215:516-2519(+)|eukprot:CAMPEP_0119560216 /NCGR_PEP_ID=MMETSP1352-20130426/14270_1 /TAXON_ID=265584 /ORGANISM="Stauroneis constricta, Strain CCMP1120" /LENGTH=667 /DNA_ID=CAMNT_0007608149 /DNA_START=278 /DNA_END=2281 /DNA_ORIENTATION=+